MSKKKLIIVISLVLVLVGAMAAWQWYASRFELKNSEKSEAYKKLLGRDLKEAVSVETRNYQGKNFSLQYPSTLSEKTNQATQSAKPVVETLRLTGFDPRLDLTVMVTEANGGVLEEFSAVAYRTQSEDYRKSEQPIAGTKAAVFTKKDEKTAFFKTKELIYSISVTGHNTEEIEKLFNSTLLDLKI